MKNVFTHQVSKNVINPATPWALLICLGLAALLPMSGAQAQGGAAYPRAGWQTTLTPVSHGVRGIATIVDADTFRVDQFFFDGLGIRVYFYLGAVDTRASFTAGLETGNNLRTGTAFTNTSITVDLPAGRTFDDFTALSVWCTGVSSSFGSGTFMPPRDNWRRVNFGDAANTGTGADAADPDADGLTNLIEYATHSDPRSGSPSPWQAPTLIAGAGSAAAQRFSFSYRRESRDVRYRILRSGDLQAWQEVYQHDLSGAGVTRAAGVTSEESPGDQTILVSDGIGGARAFWRLVVESTP